MTENSPAPKTDARLIWFLILIGLGVVRMVDKIDIKRIMPSGLSNILYAGVNKTTAMPTVPPATPTPTPTPTTQIVYTRKVSNIRSGPGFKFSVIATAPINTPLITDKTASNGWLKISHSNLPEGGWIYLNLIALTPITQQQNNNWGYSNNSGHDAGYEWAEENDIDDEANCDGKSESFNEGCIQFVEENYSYDAGHDWAEENNIIDKADCEKSGDYYEGCESYVDEN